MAIFWLLTKRDRPRGYYSGNLQTLQQGCPCKRVPNDKPICTSVYSPPRRGCKTSTKKDSLTIAKDPCQPSIRAFAKSTKYKKNSKRWARSTAAVSKYIAKEMDSFHTVEKQSFKELLNNCNAALMTYFHLSLK